MTISKRLYSLNCENCDSEYEIICLSVSYEYLPDNCPFCGGPVDIEEDDDAEEDY